MALVRVKDFEESRAFLRKAGFCLRYWGSDSLPIASMYDAVLGKQKKASSADQKIAIQLVNQLLEKREAIEVNVIADRVCLVHRSIMPILYSLVRQKSKSGAISKLSSEAEEVLSLIQEQGQIVTGDVRELLGIPSVKTSDDPAYVVLSELQRHLLIDRGPFKISNQAIPYLAKEGYPYHLFEEAHLELAKEGEEIKVEQARNQWLMAFLKSCGECSLRKMESIFKVFLTKDEIESGIQELVSARRLKIEKGKGNLNVSVM
jgi:hypothetical protein